MIRKMQTAAGGALLPSKQDMRYQTAAANKLGEWFLKGLGTVGKILTAPFTSQGPTSATIYKSKELLAKERTIENKSEEQLGKAMTWVSPLNYGAALATGNGLNARKGEEEVASWAPAWQALGRAAELYFGPKAVKGVKATSKTVVNTAAKAGVKPAKAAVVAREINKAIKEIPNSGIVDNIGKKWFTDEVTFKSPFRVKEHTGQTVGDVIDFNLGLYGGSKATLASLTPNQRYSLAKLLWLTDERPVMSKLIHMEDSGTLPISRTGFVPKDASNSNSVWNSSLGSNAPEIWYLEGTPYYSAYGYPNISNIPRTIITDRQSLNNIGINLKGNKVIRHEGEIPFNLIELGIQYNPITGFFDKIKFDSGTKSFTLPNTSLKFFERKPFNSKLKKSEEAGVPKGERNNRLHGQTLAPYYDYSLINKHYEPWTVNEKGLFVFGAPEKVGKLGTLHFTFNEPVMSHMMGSWDDAPTVTLLPYRNVRSLAAPVDMAIMDTFFPNYKGLKISSRGAKTLTGDKKTFDYYKSKGLDVEFSPEMEGLLLQLQGVKAKLELLKSSGHDYFSPEMLELYKQQRAFKDKINSIGVDWSKKHVKPIPSYEKVNALGKAEGFDMEQYPYRLASPKKDAYGMPLEASDTELNYTWQSDPSNHFMVGEHPEVVLKSALNGEYGKVRPEFIKYLKWASKNKADYRKKGGKLCLIPRRK